MGYHGFNCTRLLHLFFRDLPATLPVVPVAHLNKGPAKSRVNLGKRGERLGRSLLLYYHIGFPIDSLARI